MVVKINMFIVDIGQHQMGSRQRRVAEAALRQLLPAIGHGEKVALHGLQEALFVLLRRDDRGQFALAAQKAALLDHRLDALVQGECANVIFGECYD